MEVDLNTIINQALQSNNPSDLRKALLACVGLMCDREEYLGDCAGTPILYCEVCGVESEYKNCSFAPIDHDDDCVAKLYEKELFPKKVIHMPETENYEECRCRDCEQNGCGGCK